MPRPFIDLSGPDGNAFVIMARAKQYAKEFGKDSKPILERMRSGDYENLVAVFDKEFGEYVDIYPAKPDNEDED